MNKINGMAFCHMNQYPNRPTIVFLHDSLGSIELWRNLPNELAAVTKCNVLVYDRLGYGKSDPMLTSIRSKNYLEVEADILIDLLIDLKIDKPILLGHSDGGSIALIVAGKYPNQIKGAIIEAGHIFVEEITLRGIYDAKKAYETTNLPNRLKKYHGDKTETIFKAWTETWISKDFKNWNIEHFVSNIVVPILFIQGKNDEYGTLEQVDKTLDLVKGKSDKFIIPDVGHTPHKEIPDLFLETVKEFILRIEK
ncbi:alpha/beta hydrolase [Chishuiella sp.]|uniref:alpha/beta fold hydrolase n=2 Tax=Chishuiella sp. TaxID=1969467 RepID=UPI0028AAFF53|nr:alpha/beta hydrolase [Chishuiella sp.]